MSNLNRVLLLCQTYIKCRFSWNENLQLKQNSTCLKGNAGNVKAVLSSEQPFEVSSNIGGVKNMLREHAVDTRGHLI